MHRIAVPPTIPDHSCILRGFIVQAKIGPLPIGETIPVPRVKSGGRVSSSPAFGSGPVFSRMLRQGSGLGVARAHRADSDGGKPPDRAFASVGAARRDGKG